MKSAERRILDGGMLEGRQERHSTLMHLPHGPVALVQRAVDGRGDGERAADDGAHADQEARERLLPRLAVDDFHRGDVLRWRVCVSEGKGTRQPQWGGFTYVGEEDTGDSAFCVQALLVAVLFVVAAVHAALVARDAVLVGLDAAVVAVAQAADVDPFVRVVVHARVYALAHVLFPAERQVRRRHHLDEVHVVVCALVRVLLRAIERVDVVVRPHASDTAHGFDGALWHGWPEA